MQKNTTQWLWPGLERCSRRKEFGSSWGHLATQKQWQGPVNSLLIQFSFKNRAAHLCYGHLTEKTSSWRFRDVHVLQKEHKKQMTSMRHSEKNAYFSGKVWSKLLLAGNCEAVDGTRKILVGNWAATGKLEVNFGGKMRHILKDGSVELWRLRSVIS